MRPLTTPKKKSTACCTPAPAAKAVQAVEQAQCCAKVSRVVAGCHD